jgi:hypothetical protein
LPHTLDAWKNERAVPTVNNAPRTAIISIDLIQEFQMSEVPTPFH